LFNVSSYIRDPQHVEDVAQEVGLIVFKKLPELREPEAFNGWLARIVTNECYRASKAARKVVESELDIEDYEEGLYEEDKEFLPEEYAESAELRDVILQTIAKLSPQRKQMIIMYFYDDLSYKEIAAAMDVTTSTVSTGIMRAKKVIKDNLNKAIEKDSKLGKPGIIGTVVGAALEYEAIGLYPDESIFRIVSSFSDKLASSQGARTKKKSPKSEAKQLLQTVVISAAGIGIAIVVGIQTFGEPSVKAQPEAEPPTQTEESYTAIEPASPEELEINFLSGECECGHLNPKGISLTGEFKKSDVRWKIVKVREGEAISTGEGEDVSGELVRLFGEKRDGDYNLQFDFEGPDGCKYTLNRGFTIDTEEARLGQYY
jgi:RNA polymerase sigma-70 factor (ECF subfamily)